jgi:predicted RNA-binding Zn-ribbon protein involved in translation (DUF1610 family)
MECRICRTETNEILPTGDFEEYACPKCGPYKITGSAVAVLEKHGYRLDVDLCREWLAQQGPQAVPVIDSDLAMRLIAT